MTAREIWKLGYRAGRVRGQVTGEERYRNQLSTIADRLDAIGAMSRRDEPMWTPGVWTPGVSWWHEWTRQPRRRTLWQRIARRFA